LRQIKSINTAFTKIEHEAYFLLARPVFLLFSLAPAGLAPTPKRSPPFVPLPVPGASHAILPGSSYPFTNLGGTPGFGGLALAFPIVVLGFVGWDNSGALAEETKHPRRAVSITVFVSVFIVGLIYFLSSYSMVVGFASMNLKDPMGALSIDPSPFLTIARHYLPWFLAILGVVGITSSAGYYIASATSQTRIIFNSGREGILPPFFARVTRGVLSIIHTTANKRCSFSTQGWGSPTSARWLRS
jgi:amino acid transporter